MEKKQAFNIPVISVFYFQICIYMLVYSLDQRAEKKSKALSLVGQKRSLGVFLLMF